MQRLPARRACSWLDLKVTLTLALALTLSPCMAPCMASAADLEASTALELRDAILTANAATTTTHTITLTADITLDQVLTPIIANVDFIGNGHTVSGDGKFQIFFVQSGDVRFSDMTLKKGLSLGGSGAARGGGGLGAGGALFVDETGVVTVTNVVFEDNVAKGGSGGLDLGPRVGGGGGGFHGDGAISGGGGGGYDGDGGANAGGGGGMEGNGESSVDGGNGGGQFEDGDGGAGGGLGSGQVLGPGGNGGPFEGGGGGSPGGDGGYFGGGGGSGGVPGDGGDFGGGGGTADISVEGVGGRAGGVGGFGGGGGGGSLGAGGATSLGGFGGGASSAVGVGGAGSSLGGAVFVRTGGTLTFELDNTVDVTTGNKVESADRGSGAPDVEGDDLYVMDGVDVELSVSPGATATMTGSIAGEGGLLKSGTGTLRLTGTNSYAGGTDVVDAGTLSGTTSSLQGDIDVGAVSFLEFDQSTNGTYAGVLSGAGTLDKRGTGTLTLSGANTHSGTTNVHAGTLQVSTSSLSGASTTHISTGATLDFSQSANGTFAGLFAGGVGVGTLRKSGAGTVTFTADNGAFVGATNVNEGGLRLLSGAKLGGPIDVATGGLLGGAGEATGSLTLRGTLAPGDGGFETLTIDGALLMEPTARLSITLDDAGQNSAVAVTGAATADGALDLFITAGNYTTAKSYDILSSGAGLLTDLSLTLPSDFCFFEATTTSTASALTLHLTPTLDGLEENCADTRNQKAVAHAIEENLGDPSLQPILENLNILRQDEVGPALDEMGGEGLGGFTTARLAAGSQFINTLSQRMRDPGNPSETSAEYPLAASSFETFGGGTLIPGLGASTSAFAGSGFATSRRGFDESQQSPFSFVSMRGDSGIGGWLEGFAVFAETGSNDNTHDADFNLYGTSAGVDYAFAEGLVGGVALGYTHTKLSVSHLATFGDGDTAQTALYGTYSTDHFYVGSLFRYAFSDLETSRRVSFGQLYEKPQGSSDGHEYTGYLEGGLAALPLSTAKLQPMASFLYTELMQDGFSEKKADSTALRIDDDDTTSMVTSLGTRIYKHYPMSEDADVIPELRIRWAHDFGDVDRDVNAEFASVGGASAFKVKGANPGRDVAIVGVGWTVLGDGGTTLGLNYDATVNEEFVSHALQLLLLLRY